MIWSRREVSNVANYIFFFLDGVTSFSFSLFDRLLDVLFTLLYISLQFFPNLGLLRCSRRRGSRFVWKKREKEKKNWEVSSAICTFHCEIAKGCCEPPLGREANFSRSIITLNASVDVEKIFDAQSLRVQTYEQMDGRWNQITSKSRSLIKRILHNGRINETILFVPWKR